MFIGQHHVIVSLSQSDLLLLVELPYRLELMFLNAGTTYLSYAFITHTSTISFQSKINGEVGNVDFTIKSR